MFSAIALTQAWLERVVRRSDDKIKNVWNSFQAAAGVVAGGDCRQTFQYGLTANWDCVFCDEPTTTPSSRTGVDPCSWDWNPQSPDPQQRDRPKITFACTTCAEQTRTPICYSNFAEPVTLKQLLAPKDQPPTAPKPVAIIKPVYKYGPNGEEMTLYHKDDVEKLSYKTTGRWAVNMEKVENECVERIKSTLGNFNHPYDRSRLWVANARRFLQAFARRGAAPARLSDDFRRSRSRLFSRNNLNPSILRIVLPRGFP